jgi:Na+/melibiose symporter-like transporter
MKKLMVWLSLFTSTGTLLCCALPALLVTLGLGSVMVGLVSHFPALVWLSNHKVWVFLISGVMLILSGVLMYIAKNQPCPIDPSQAEMCQKTRKWSVFIYVFSCVIYLIGFTFAYVLPWLMAE